MMQGRKSEIYVHFTHYVFSNAKLSPRINHHVRIDRCWFFGVENYRVPRHFLARFAALFSSVYINFKIELLNHHNTTEVDLLSLQLVHR